MKVFLNSRRFQIAIVACSLGFILWLSMSLWLDAFEQRTTASKIQRHSAKEEHIFYLAELMAEERKVAYKLYKTYKNTPADIQKYKALSDKYESALSRYATEEIPAPSLMAANSGKNNSASESMKSDDESGHGHSQHENEHHHNKMTLLDHSSVNGIISQLARHREQLYKELHYKYLERNSDLGMNIFHDYTSYIDILDELRLELHIVPSRSKREFYTHSKLKDIVWTLRESTLQIYSLIKGIITKAETTRIMAKTRHHSDMLIELNTRIDLAWSELIKVVVASENTDLLSSIQTASTWYSDVLRNSNKTLAASTRYNAVSLEDLRGWLNQSEQFLQYIETVQAHSDSITLESIRSVKNKATSNLLLTSVLVAFSVLISLASIFFFIRVFRMAHKDELTGLDNRRMFCARLDSLIASSDSSKSTIGLLMIDLDRFKYINDTLGHSAGDQLLKMVSAQIAEVAPESRSLARLGGDEFALLFTGYSAIDLAQIAKQVQERMKDSFCIDGAIVNIGSSIGIAQYPEDADTHDALIRAADLAMYCAKKSGANLVVAYDKELDQTMASNARLVNDLQLALKENQFELFYQPQYNLAKGRVVGVEALIRWNHPLKGQVAPNDFIPIAEENGLLPSIGNWVLNEACEQASSWLKNDMPLRVAVNISADHFFNSDFEQTVFKCLKKHDLPPNLLAIEVTEGVAISDINVVVESLARLRQSSIHVALDDFGTGYSSLSYLQDLPLDTLKIDKSFIQKMLKGNEQHDSITESIVSLSQSLQLETVAEGVETSDQLSAVANMQISVVQGYYYSKPVPAAELASVVQQINNNGNDLEKAA